MIRATLALLLILGGLGPARISAREQPIQFTREFAAVSGQELNLNWRETQRIERFLRRVFPYREMRWFERRSSPPLSQSTGGKIARRIEYAVVAQEGYRFLLVHFYSEQGNAPGTSVIAVYRVERDGPNQVWRSRAWQSTYDGFYFQTAKLGTRNIVLFKEGGADGGFGLAGVFSFHNVPAGLYLDVLTPQMPRLAVLTRFPVRPLLARNISMDAPSARTIVFVASDRAFGQSSRYMRRWRFNERRWNFEATAQSEEAEK